MKREKLAAAFNLWMERFIENPEKFQREFQIVADFEQQRRHTAIPSYGDDCVAYLESLMAEV